jgi:redox-regulated HSP33 family molecular chaperone
MTQQGYLQKFIFDNAAVRGELVEISATWREVQARHDYPSPSNACWARWWRRPRCCRPT